MLLIISVVELNLVFPPTVNLDDKMQLQFDNKFFKKYLCKYLFVFKCLIKNM